MDDKVIEMIRDDIKELKLDVKSLLLFKYQIIGSSMAISFVITLVFQVASYFIKR